MKSYKILFALIAVFALMLASANVMAVEISRNPIAVKANDVDLLWHDITAYNGEELEIEVQFVADITAEDVRVEVALEGENDEVEVESAKFNIIAGKTYTKTLTLELPEDLEELTEDVGLYIKIVKGEDVSRISYSLTLERETYDLSILSVDFPSEVPRNRVVPVTVVFKNVGHNRLDDIFVVASIPALGVSTRGYSGDIIPEDSGASYEEDEEDTMEKTVYLTVPESTPMGDYELKVKVYDDDDETEGVTTGTISVSEAMTARILAGTKNKEIAAGETVDYEVILVNNADDVRVLEITTTSSSVLDLSAPSVVTVEPRKSTTFVISATADSNAEVGSYKFTAEVEGNPVEFTANVVKEKAGVSSTIVALTVVLAVIFVILLMVLVVLITRKDKAVEEVETSYY